MSTTIRSNEINHLALALSKAQGKFKGVVYNKINPHFKTKYADLEAYLQACREELEKNELSFVQTFSCNERIEIITLLMHSSGQYIESILTITNKDVAPQELGKFITYMRRYSIASMLGIAPCEEDDDGNAAQKAHNESVALKNKSSEPKKQNFSPLQVSQFCEKHQLFTKEGESISLKRQFLLETCSKSNKQEDDIINSMMHNEDRFEESFDKWIQSNSLTCNMTGVYIGDEK